MAAKKTRSKVLRKKRAQAIKDRDASMRPIIIAGIILLVLFVLLPASTPESQGSVAGDASTTNVTVNIGDQETSPSTPSTPADLRLIAGPYLVASNIENICLIAGADWHNESDFVGCVGIGPTALSCSNDGTIIAANTQCIGSNANWFCAPSGVYCKY